MTEKEKHIERDLHRYSLMLQVKTPSLDTQKNYFGWIKKYLNEINFNAKKATTVQITEYIVTNCKSRSSMAQCRSAIKMFYETVYRQNNKVEWIPYPKQIEQLKDIPNHEQMVQLIDLTDNVKHKLLITFLYGTGMRCAELRGIRWCDIRREVGENPLSVKVHGKGAKDRYLPLSEKINALLKDYCKEYKLGCETNKNHFVFGNIYGAPYSAKSVANVVEAAGKRIGIELTPHMIRHATMEQLSKVGMQLLEIQDICGHQSAKTTRIYTKANNVNKVMPV